MSGDVFPGLPIPVTLALAALVLILLGLARVLASLGKPVTLRFPCDERGPAGPDDLERQPN